MTNNMQGFKENNVIKNISAGVVKSFIITVILIMLVSIMLVNTNISENIIGPGIFVITFISIFAGAMSSIKNNGIIYGAVIGIIYIVSIYLLSSLLNGEFGLTISSLILMILSVLAGATGGVTGMNIKRDRKKI